MRKRWYPVVWMAWLLLLSAAASQAQQSPEMILYNGRIITVDDHSFTSRIGTIAQAMHVRNGRILHVGSNDQIRPMAGQNTKVIDLKGRAVIPGMILTHEHPWDWNPVEPSVTRKVLTDDLVVTRFLEGSPQENLKAFPGVLAEAVQKARPGQWIYIVFTNGKDYEWSTAGNNGFGRIGMDPEVFNPLSGDRITQEQLDAAAPHNPVVLRDVFTSMVVNQKAIDESRQVYTQPDVNPARSAPNLADPTGGSNRAPNLIGDPSTFRWFFGDVLMRNYHPQLVELMRLGLEWWAGYGLTAFSSNAYTASNLQVYDELDRKSRLPIRTMWSWNWRQNYFYSDPYFLKSMALNVGKGTDYVWFGGGRAVTGGGCTILEGSPSSKLIHRDEVQVEARQRQCNYAPGARGAQLLYDWIKAGGRYVGNHTTGDGDMDNIFLVIEKASKDAGMTEEEIRAKRHGVDHMALWPRTDQIPYLKRLGIITSGDAFEIFQSSPAVFDIYGERGIEQVVPFKRVFDAGIYSGACCNRCEHRGGALRLVR